VKRVQVASAFDGRNEKQPLTQLNSTQLNDFPQFLYIESNKLYLIYKSAVVGIRFTFTHTQTHTNPVTDYGTLDYDLLLILQ